MSKSKTLLMSLKKEIGKPWMGNYLHKIISIYLRKNWHVGWSTTIISQLKQRPECLTMVLRFETWSKWPIGTGRKAQHHWGAKPNQHEEQACSLSAKTLLGPHSRASEFKSRFYLQSQLRSTEHSRRRQWWLRWLGPCHLHGRPELSFWLLVSAGSSPAFASVLKALEERSLPPFLPSA